MNTKADALSRIKISSDALKEMIPTSSINVITRSMNIKKNKKENNEEEENNEKDDNFNKESGQTHIWNCTSISDIKNVKRIQFKACARDDDNKKNKGLFKININEKGVIVEHSDNPATNLGLILEKLLIKTNEYKIRELALANNDKIFEYINVNEFKRIFNELQHKEKYTYRLKRGTIRPLEILLYTPPKEIKDEEEMLQIIENYHMSPHGGHIGIKRCINRLKQKYVWKNMNKMVKNFVNNCEICAKNKQIRHTKEPLQITDTPNTSFESVSIDTVGPLRMSNGYRYILTLQCELTKFVEAFPLETKHASTIAKTLVEKFILKYGCFKVLKSDMGTEFKNELMANICKLLKITHITSTPFHHETLGSIERNHRVLNEYMLSFTDDNNWDEWLPYYTFCYNTTPHTDTSYTPFELVFGKITTLPCETINSADKIYNLDDYASELKLKLRRAQERAKELLEKAKHNRKKQKDEKCSPSKFKINDLVYLKKGNRRKNESPYTGPFRIIEQNGVNSTIKMNDKKITIHNNRLVKSRNNK